MRIKKGVKLFGLRPEMVVGLMVCDSVYKEFGKELVVTSLTDSKHSAKSAHYNGCGADLRTHYFTEDELRRVHSKLESELGGDFVVLLESDHFHISYKPGRPG